MKFNKEKLRDMIIDIGIAYRYNQEEKIELYAKLIIENFKAKQALRDKGYGWTGLGIVETIELVPECED